MFCEWQAEPSSPIRPTQASACRRGFLTLPHSPTSLTALYPTRDGHARAVGWLHILLRLTVHPRIWSATESSCAAELLLTKSREFPSLPLNRTTLPIETVSCEIRRRKRLISSSTAW